MASFNIQVFGRTKREKPDVMTTLVDIVEDYDLIAVQEFRDATETTVGIFLDALDATGTDFDVVAGPRLGRTSSKEQHAFYWRTAVLGLLPGAYTYADPGERFEREPHCAHFRVRDQALDFVVINIHTKPDDATAEIAALVDAIADAQQLFPDEGEFLVLSDFNADGSYYDEDDATQPLRAPAYRWVIPNDADTTVAASSNTYDRLVFLAATTDEDFEGSWGVRRFDAEPAFTARGIGASTVSDHYPIWARFFVSRDTR